MEGPTSRGRGWFRIPDEKRQLIIEDYKNGSSMLMLSEKHGVTWLTVRSILRKAEVEIRPNKAGLIIKRSTKLFPDVKGKIIEDYKTGLGSTELEKKYGISQTAISKVVKGAGLTRSDSESKRVYSFDEGAFDKDSEEASYWTGFLMADGSVIGSSGHSPNVTLTLQERDRAHVEKFKIFLKTEHPVLTVKSSGNTKGLPNTYARLSVRSARLAESLARRGVAGNKLYRTMAGAFKGDVHFWRGVIDGDGGIWVDKEYSGRLRLYLCGSKQLLEEFREYSLLVSPKQEAQVWSTRSKAFQFHLTGVHAARMIHRLYKGATVFLDRKMELAQKVISNPTYDLGLMEARSDLFAGKTECSFSMCPECGCEVVHEHAPKEAVNAS